MKFHLLLIVSIIILKATLKVVAQPRQFVPEDFNVPDSLVTPDFKLKPLSTKFCELDYMAVMNSLEHLQGVLGPNSDWPNPKMTLEESRNSIIEDHKLFKQRIGFSYSVLNRNETEVLGCIYIFPARKGFDAEIVVWVSKKEFDNGLDPILVSRVKEWVNESWPFKKVVFPGREISWEEWLKD